MTPVSPDALREAMSGFPTGVTVVTAIGSAGPAGATANAVASLSLEPPMMLAALDLGSRTLVAVELSPDTAERCRERVGGRAEVVVGNVETGEGLAGREFDAIVGVSVLHHVDLEATFAATFSLLRPGGPLPPGRRARNTMWRLRRGKTV